MKKVVITGGIGSGKSTISKCFKKKGFAVHDSDIVVNKLYDKPKKKFLTFLQECGFKNVIKNKKINKSIIINNIFFDKRLKIKLEKYIHKEVRFERNRFIKEQIKLKEKVIFFDIPLLLENNLENQFDLVLCVISNKKNRSRRIMKNKKFSKKILDRIYKNQTTDKQRKLRSDIIITNNKTKKNFIFKAEKILIDITR